MFKYFLLGVLCLFGSRLGVAQTDYYWAGEKKITLTPVADRFIITAEEASSLAGANISQVKQYEYWPHKPYAVVHTGDRTTREAVVRKLGLTAQTLQVSPGYQLPDGYVMFPT
ncbi:MAG: hypothetical protein AAGA62_19815, partial [Bacteroidota bacterium]